MSGISALRLSRHQDGLDARFRDDIVTGLSSRPRTLPPRWFYDRRGSELFEDITRLPEYYLTRAEREILADHAAAIAATVGTGTALIELGSGSSTKTPLLLDALAATAYVPIDISGEFLAESAAVLGQRFPGLPVYPLAADFTSPFQLPAAIQGLPRTVYFAGSTIGNMTVAAATDFLRTLATIVGRDAYLLIGIDRIKNVGELLAAYDDSQGVTAQFNLNLLHRINRELSGTVPVAAFRHVARWNDFESRMEMHLEALRDVRFEVAGITFSIGAGETIHTENSLKYGPRDARTLLRAGLWSPVREWTDRDGRFALVLARS